MRSERYQIALIFLGILSTAFFAVFFYRELFPEYLIYQNDYIALEKFRSTYTGEAPTAFREGVKQIVFEREDKGPPLIDRCISCHVALQLPHFSPTKIQHDVNGNIVRDADGVPVKVANEDYIWSKLDRKIAELTDPQVIKQLEEEGERSKVHARIAQADELRALKTAKVGDRVYDVSKVLVMHPLIGKETRPFEFHSLDEYGCTSCHGGNGKGLTTDKSHGPVFDEEYEVEFMGPKPEFLEHDEKNDPAFSRVFNHKPSDALLFQTTPILVGHLIEAKCIQCHEQSAAALQSMANSAGVLAGKRKKQTDALLKGYNDEKEALRSLIQLKQSVSKDGLAKTIARMHAELGDLSLSPVAQEHLNGQISFLNQADKGKTRDNQQQVLDRINGQLVFMLGSLELVNNLERSLAESKTKQEDTIDRFLQQYRDRPDATGTLFTKWQAINLEKSLMKHVEDIQTSFSKTASDEQVISSLVSDVDLLTKDYHRGEQLYISQACYACHRIAGFSRGGVGPELTRAGGLYPWYMKEKIVWPQGSLKTSRMPNMVLDHVEVEDLMAFLLGQKGPGRAVSEIDYKVALQEWEAGRKMAWEKPVPPSKLHDLRFAMTVFATEGCAACHRLEGFESNVGYRVENQQGDKPSFEALYKEREWFRKLFPESIAGSQIVQALDTHADEIDKHIVDNVRKDSLLEEIQKKYPDTIESLYSNFRFASRAKNHQYEEIAPANDHSKQHQTALAKLDEWKNRLHRVFMMYVQEYGLGRLIGPRPNWAGVYRSDEWLMEHFHNPAGHVPNSIMPILPFDDSKFYALTYMLDVLGKRNRDQLRSIWEHRGFDPSLAFQLHCAQCHGDYLQGNGPVAEWIYPIPKNLRNVEFLRNLTKENAIQSVTHGVKGTPMPPWGETPKDKYQYDGIPVLNANEISMLVDWLYSSISGSGVIQDSQEISKWRYTPKDVIEELHKEKGKLIPESTPASQKPSASEPMGISNNKKFGRSSPYSLSYSALGERFYADVSPKVTVSERSKDDQEVGSVFDVLRNPISGADKNVYYIKKKYYTPENIEQGRRFFEANCAVCHGKDADGAGIRASIMLDAKPRMLINLDWIKMRDDMRLLRSIKYGVAGTAMTPWGDLTSSLQRIQLVIFIRSLNRENEIREELSTYLYQGFDQSLEMLERARSSENGIAENLQSQIDNIQKEQRTIVDEAQIESDLGGKAVELYKKQIELRFQLRQNKALDQLLIDLKGLVKRESNIYRDIGMDLNRAGIDDDNWNLYLEVLKLNEGRVALSDGHLFFKPVKASEVEEKINRITANIDKKIISLQKHKISIQGKIGSEERTSELVELDAQINTLTKANRRLQSGWEEIKGINKREDALFHEYQEKKTKNKSGIETNGEI